MVVVDIKNQKSLVDGKYGESTLKHGSCFIEYRTKIGINIHKGYLKFLRKIPKQKVLNRFFLQIFKLSLTGCRTKKKD